MRIVGTLTQTLTANFNDFAFVLFWHANFWPGSAQIAAGVGGAELPLAPLTFTKLQR